MVSVENTTLEQELRLARLDPGHEPRLLRRERGGGVGLSTLRTELRDWDLWCHRCVGQLILIIDRYLLLFLGGATGT